MQSQLYNYSISCEELSCTFFLQTTFVFCFVFIYSEICMSYTCLLLGQALNGTFTVRYKDPLILFIKVRGKSQFCRNVEAHRRCVGQTLGTRFKDFIFRKSYVLKPSAAETQADIFTVGVYHYKTHFIKILSWVLPALILFTDVEVHKMVIFCCFCHF